MEIEEEVISTDESIILKFIVKNMLWCCEHYSCGSVRGPVVGFYIPRSESYVCIEAGGIFFWQSKVLDTQTQSAH
jgi:hypothetical protein